MNYVLSTDATTVEATRASLPARLTGRLDTGEWATPTEATAAAFGWHRTTISGTDGGAGWTLGPPVNTGPGVFVRTWVFDQGLADAQAEQADRDADQTALTAELATARTNRTDAAAQAAEMVTGDPTYHTRWDDEDTVRVPAITVLTNAQANAITLTEAGQAIRALQLAANQLGARERAHAVKLNLHTVMLRRLWAEARQAWAALARVINVIR